MFLTHRYTTQFGLFSENYIIHVYASTFCHLKLRRCIHIYTVMLLRECKNKSSHFSHVFVFYLKPRAQPILMLSMLVPRSLAPNFFKIFFEKYDVISFDSPDILVHPEHHFRSHLSFLVDISESLLMILVCITNLGSTYIYP